MHNESVDHIIHETKEKIVYQINCNDSKTLYCQTGQMLAFELIKNKFNDGIMYLPFDSKSFTFMILHDIYHDKIKLFNWKNIDKQLGIEIIELMKYIGYDMQKFIDFVDSFLETLDVGFAGYCEYSHKIYGEQNNEEFYTKYITSLLNNDDDVIKYYNGIVEPLIPMMNNNFVEKIIKERVPSDIEIHFFAKWLIEHNGIDKKTNERELILRYGIVGEEIIELLEINKFLYL